MNIAGIILAGGRGTRIGGAVKGLLRVGEHTLFEIAVDAARQTSSDPIIAVGDRTQFPQDATDLPVRWVREDPPFGGPAAAIITALHSLPASASPHAGAAPQALGALPETAATVIPEWTLILAADLPRAPEAALFLAASIPLLPSDADGVCLGDSHSRPQWLTGIYRTVALAEAATTLPHQGHDARVRDLLRDLAITVIADPSDLSADVDTWEDHKHANDRISEVHDD